MPPSSRAENVGLLLNAKATPANARRRSWISLCGARLILGWPVMSLKGWLVEKTHYLQAAMLADNFVNLQDGKHCADTSYIQCM